ncbi:MAG: NADH-quinone oxidoreductase subunit N [Deltaproteobacteria bacterium]|nr:NADH-quinone oxidoreductase subunit N [Deltaproteobacteria bacterium]
MVADDGFARFFQVMVLLATLVALPLSAESVEIPEEDRPELFALLLAASFGAMLLVASTDLVMLYLSFEFVSILSYVLACYRRGSRSSAEAGLEYVIYGGVASGLMVYGFSLLCGLGGLTCIAACSRPPAAPGDGFAPAAMVGCALALVGFGYKVASAPFHMWAPDVYEGAPTPVTAYFSVVPKAAGFAALVRFLFGGFTVQDGPSWRVFAHVDWVPLLEVMCVLTMTVGNLAAMAQRKVKRMLAYSGVAHAGYVLIGVVVLTSRGLEATLVYLFVYSFMNLGAFAVVAMVVNRTGSDDLEAFKGLFWRGRQGAFVAVLATAFFFALVGAPPTAGFTGKLLLFSAAVEHHSYGIVVAALLNTLISVYYYFKVFQAMFLTSPSTPEKLTWSGWALALLLVLALPTIGFGVRSESLIAIARASLHLVGV